MLVGNRVSLVSVPCCAETPCTLPNLILRRYQCTVRDVTAHQYLHNKRQPMYSYQQHKAVPTSHKHTHTCTEIYQNAQIKVWPLRRISDHAYVGKAISNEKKENTHTHVHTHTRTNKHTQTNTEKRFVAMTRHMQNNSQFPIQNYPLSKKKCLQAGYLLCHVSN